jgi:hypothetical protein
LVLLALCDLREGRDHIVLGADQIKG